jgi:hypothetical protein
MPAGRPTDYTPELLEKAWNYINSCPDKIPSIEGLCDEINIARTTCYVWAKDDEKEFKHILEALMRKQGKTLINNGLDGTFNPTISKLILTKHGYSDKQETEISGNLTLTDLTEEQLDAKIAEKMSKLNQNK